MTYKILSVSQVDDTIMTTVQLQLTTVMTTVTISHFRPLTKEQIEDEIKNRAYSEQARLDAIDACASVISTITIGETVSF
jgi:hypothetical protein